MYFTKIAHGKQKNIFASDRQFLEIPSNVHQRLALTYSQHNSLIVTQHQNPELSRPCIAQTREILPTQSLNVSHPQSRTL